MFLKVENEKSLVRDTTNGAILNVDKDSLTKYRNMKRLRKMDKERINQLETEVEQLSDAVEQIKQMLLTNGIKIN